MFTLRAVGENAVMLSLGDRVDPLLASRAQAAVAAIEGALGQDLVDLVPSYASVLVLYDNVACSHLEICRRIKSALEQCSGVDDAQSRTITLPVYYAPESGADLERLAQTADLDIDRLIDLHSAAEYRVYAIGFAPGFAYLGQVDARIAAPRLESPRSRVPKGSVAIADRQTAVYPATSPGGWNLIGRCPTPLFDPASDPCMPLAVGDRVQFEPVTRARYLALGGDLS